jgi:hypothetical protein
MGIFVALDHTGMLTLREAIEIVEDNERSLGTALISLALIQSMERPD